MNKIIKNPFENIKLIFRFSISSWINFIVSIISSFIFTRLFSPNILGELNLFTSASSFLMGIFSLGLDSSYLRFYFEIDNKDDRNALLKRILIICFVIFSIFSILILLFFDYISVLIFSKSSLILVSMLLINTLSYLILNFYSISYRLSNNTKMYTIQNISVQILTKLGIIAFYFFSYDIEIVITSITAIVLIISLLTLYKNNIFKNTKKSQFRIYSSGFYKYAIYSWPLVFIIHANSFFPQFLIFSNIGTFELGIFFSVNIIIGALNVLQSGFRVFWANYMYGNYKEKKDFIYEVHNYVLFFSAVVFTFVVISKDFFYILLGPSYQESSNFFSLLVLIPIINLIQETTSYGTTIYKKTFINLISNIVILIFSTYLIHLIINTFQLIGVSTILLLSEIIRFSLATFYGQRYFKTINNSKRSLLIIISMILLAIINSSLINKFDHLYLYNFLILFIYFYAFRKELKSLIYKMYVK